MAGLVAIKTRAYRAVRGARTRLRDLGRFHRLRALFVAAFAADVAVTVLFVVASYANADRLVVSYRAEFPTRLIVVRNRSQVMADAEVILDARYRFVIPRLDVGSIGIDLRDFRDEGGLPPDRAYRPTTAVIEHENERFELQVGTSESSP